MSINTAKIELLLLQKIDNSVTPEEALAYSKILEKLQNNHIFTVFSFSDLPDSSENIGKLYYVSDEESVYASAGDVYINLKYSTESKELYYAGGNERGEAGIGSCGIPVTIPPSRESTNSSNWTFVSGGYMYAGAIKSDGSLWTWGGTCCSQLGRSACDTGYCNPNQEVSSSTWCEFSAGRYGSIGIKSDGTLWTWGTNKGGTLGINSTVLCNSFSPVQEITSSTWIKSISEDGQDREGIKSDGTLWSWGYNNCGQLGDNTIIAQSSPTQEITSSTNWCFVSSGYRFVHSIKTDGTLWGWGQNSSGQIGNGQIIDYSSPVREISSSTEWCYINNGRTHSLAIKTDGTLWGWGANCCGALGTNSISVRCSPVQEITSSTNWNISSAGRIHSLAIKTDGTLWGWGFNANGRIYSDTSACVSSPRQEYQSATDWFMVCGDSRGGTYTIRNREY